MFGFGLDKGNPWLIKGDINTQVNVGYNNDLIKEYTDILNKTLNWDHELDKGQVKNHPFFKSLKLAASTEDFNNVLYGLLVTFTMHQPTRRLHASQSSPGSNGR